MSPSELDSIIHKLRTRILVNWSLAHQEAIILLADEVTELRRELVKRQRENELLTQQLDEVRATTARDISQLKATMVELTDLRARLVPFAAAEQVRSVAWQVLAGGAAAGMLPEVSGYWLVPALRALGGSQHDLRDAETLDLVRTRLLLALVALKAGQVDRAFGLISGILTPFSANDVVPWLVRRIWVALATGQFGPAGRQLLRQLLKDLLAGLPESRRAALRQQLRDRISTLEPQSRSLPRRGEPERILAVDYAPFRRAQLLLSKLRSVVEPVTVAGGGGEAQSLLTELIGEGSPAEREPLQRVAQLRAAMTDQPDQVRPALGSAAGLPVELLLADAFAGLDQPKTPVGQTTGLAWQVLGPWLLEEAEQIRARIPADLSQVDPQQVATRPVADWPVAARYEPPKLFGRRKQEEQQRARERQEAAELALAQDQARGALERLLFDLGQEAQADLEVIRRVVAG